MRLFTAIAVTAALVVAGTPAFAGKEGKNAAYAHREASCKAQAAKKFSAIHFIKRRNFVNECMGPAPMAKLHKAPPTTTGQSAK
jgi:hypothetical protein